MVVRVCLLIALCASVCAGITNVNKGFFCQDPDTGRLYGVNTTWASTSFCGNYTCKIKAKNDTMETSESKTIINVTTLTTEPVKEKINVTQALPKPEKAHVFLKDAEFFKVQEGAEAKPIFHRNSLNVIDNNQNQPDNVINSPLSDGEDRYLNGDEIKTISEILHTVKKSDLEAILEIYNLAQDIYKELDEAEASNTINGPASGLEKESHNPVKINNIEIKKGRTYWYEPSLNEIYRLADLKPEGSEFVPSSTITHRPSSTPPTYFNGVLNNQDFGRLAYYYPLSNFQKLASYYHQKPRPYSTSNVPVPSPPQPCSPCTGYPYTTTTVNDERRTYPYYTPPTKSVEPSLLPYPFSNQLNNATASVNNNYNNYHKGSPWTYYDYYRSNPYYFLKKESPNAAKTTPNPVQNEQPEPADAKTVTETPKDETKPWQTETLSKDLINEIRANIEERSKLLKMPFKKRIKLERVAKVIKLDHLNRQPRRSRDVKNAGSGENMADFEVYIEKTTCVTDNELGYFRVGNMSQPFPDCCPQKIPVR